MPVVLMLAEHVHNTSQTNINPNATAVFVYKRKSYMKIIMLLKLNSVAPATGELYSFCILVLKSCAFQILTVSFLKRSMLGI